MKLQHSMTDRFSASVNTEYLQMMENKTHKGEVKINL